MMYVSSADLKYYIISYLLDAVDGPVARYLHQTTVYGYYLDMIIDRASTITVICQAYLTSDSYPFLCTMFFYTSLAIECFSHTIVLVESHLNQQHQKSNIPNNIIARIYLTNKCALFGSIVCFEGFFISIVNNWTTLIAIFFPGMLFRTVANIMRMSHSIQMLSLDYA